MRAMLMALSIAVLLACLSHIGQGRRLQVGGGHAQTNSQERRNFSQKAIDTLSRNHSLAESKQIQSKPGVGIRKTLAMLMLAGAAFNSTAAFQVAGGRYNVNNPSGTNVGVPRSLGVASASFLNPGMPLRAPGMPLRPMRHTGPLMALTTPMEKGGDDDIKAPLGRLVASKDLLEERKKVSELDSLMLKAVKDEDFKAAARFRDEINELRLKDPVWLASELRSRMVVAVEDNDFEEAAKCRDQLRSLREFQPQYQLAGTWKGKFPEGDVFVKIRYDGDTLIAEKLDGDLSFQADVAVSNDGQSTNVETLKEILKDYPVAHFEGKGRIAVGSLVPGQLYLMSDNTIGFLFIKEDSGGGDQRVLATAGGVVDDRRGGPPRGDRDGGDEVVFVSFKQMDGYNTPFDGPPSRNLASSAAALNKLFKLDSDAGK